MANPPIPSVDPTTNLFPAPVMGALAGQFSGRTSTVRSQPLLLPKYLRKRALSQLNQSPLRILCVGDSTTAGVYSDSYTTATGSTNQGGPNSYPPQLAARLTASGLPADYASAIPGHSGNDDSRWSGSWAYAGSPFGPGANAALTATSSSQVHTLTPGVLADRYVLYFYGDPGTGTFTAQATGGSVVTINTSKPTAGTYASAVISAGSASTANTVTITGGSTAFVFMAEWWNSATPNRTRVMGAGVGGSKATDWAAGAPYGGVSFIKGVAPDLTIISLGVNDGGAGAATADVLAAVQQIAAAAAVSGDVVLMSAVPHNGAGVLDGYNAAYAASGYPYVDLQYRYGYSMNAMGLQTGDFTHPNALGYADMATAVSRLLQV